MGDSPKTPGQQQRDSLQADIRRIEEAIKRFNTHWLNYRHIVSAFAVVIMALIFAGMLVPSIELHLWGLCGMLAVAFVGVMAWRSRRAGLLNKAMEAAQKAFKDYERSRRK